MGIQVRDERHMKALTGLSQAQFDDLLPVFSDLYEATQQQRYEAGAASGTRRRKPGGGTKGKWPTMTEKLLFVLYYYKTYPTCDVLGTQFDMGLCRTSPHTGPLQRARHGCSHTPCADFPPQGPCATAPLMAGQKVVMRPEGRLGAFSSGNNDLFVPYVGGIPGRKYAGHARVGLAVHDDLALVVQRQDVHGERGVGEETDLHKDAINGQGAFAAVRARLHP